MVTEEIIDLYSVICYNIYINPSTRKVNSMVPYSTDAHLDSRERIVNDFDLEGFATKLHAASVESYNGGGEGKVELRLVLPKHTRELLRSYSDEQVVHAIEAELSLLMMCTLSDRLYVSSVFFRRPGRLTDGYVRITYRPSPSTIARQALPAGTVRGDIVTRALMR